MPQELLLNVESKQIRCALLKNGKVAELTIERKQERQLTGNIYRGEVENILENIQSAFIKINEGGNGFIHVSDIVENTKKFEQLFDLDFDRPPTPSPQPELAIEKLLKPGQPVLVQVVKEPIGSKGARLTSNVSIAGRYLVLLPNSSHKGVSRKIEGKEDRDQLKRFIQSLDLPDHFGLICRTASATATADMLIAEAQDLLNTWQSIIDNFQKSSEPTLLYTESDLIKRSVLNAIDKGYERILVDDLATYHSCKSIYQRHGEESPLKIEFYRDTLPIFERFHVEKEIEKTLKRKIWLSSGGYLFFDKTEAMYTIDVNSGRSQTSKGDVEESIVRINLEAAEEIARQLRLRNIGGLIICDFIDMRLRKSQRRVLDKLKECMKEDSAKCTILNMSEFGLIEMTRERTRGSIMQIMCDICPYCSGHGLIKSHESMSIEIERALKKIMLHYQQFALKLVTHPELDHYLKIHDKSHFERLLKEKNGSLIFSSNDSLHLNDFHFYSTLSNKRIEE